MNEELGTFANTIFHRTYAFTESEDWLGCAGRVSKFVADGDLILEDKFFKAISSRKFIPGGRYLYAAGRDIPQITNCFLLQAEDSREGWGKLLQLHVNALSLGGGVGTEYSKCRPKGTPIKRFGGTSSGPLSLMSMVNEVARGVMAGGKRRSALWAGLAWDHPDVDEFIEFKNWSTSIRAMKEADFNAQAPMDMTNLSVRLDDAFFSVVREDQSVWNLYYKICKSMCKTGEPGFSIDVGDSSKDILRNPCTEVVSSDSGDCCNLGSINFSRITDIGELEEITRLAVQFLYRGTFLGVVPHRIFEDIRKKNRRIGLGLMGLHEWCLQNELDYAPSGKLGRWLSTWEATSNDEAKKAATNAGLEIPAGIRAIAPTGTIGIIGESSTSIEPIFCVSYKRRFLDKDGKWKFSYVIDPTAERLISQGMNPDNIEDAYTLSLNVEKRIAMQAFVQDFVDQAISSTINVPEWGETGNNNAKKFAETLLKYLPRLRGVTVYPDSARAGQPLVPIKYSTAKKHVGVVYEESDDKCVGGVCGA